MTTITELEVEINRIKQRNIKVEKDKKWEMSWTRRILITIGTYILILLLLIMSGANNPLLSALIPSIAFLLSTASFEFIKKWWLDKN